MNSRNEPSLVPLQVGDVVVAFNTVVVLNSPLRHGTSHFRSSIRVRALRCLQQDNRFSTPASDLPLRAGPPTGVPTERGFPRTVFDSPLPRAVLARRLRRLLLMLVELYVMVYMIARRLFLRVWGSRGDPCRSWRSRSLNGGRHGTTQ